MIINNLKESREELDLKEYEVASVLGVSPSTVSGWETGRDTIPTMRLIKYANIYGFSLDYLFGLTYRNINYYPIRLNKESVGKKLRSMRTERGYTQKGLANILNTTQSCISFWESGKSLIPVSFIYGLINIYDNFSVDEFFDRKRIK